MPSIITILPGSTSGSKPLRERTGVDCLQIRRRNRNGLPCKLANGKNRARSQQRINDELEPVTASFFRTDKQRVSRFVFVLRGAIKGRELFHDLILPPRVLAAMTMIIEVLPPCVSTARHLFRKRLVKRRHARKL